MIAAMSGANDGGRGIEVLTDGFFEISTAIQFVAPRAAFFSASSTRSTSFS
jgi:hypothetical protein